MVGIVIVSHSAKLAEGVLELAQQMGRSQVPIAIAAGIDDPENPFGTDAIQVQAAIESVYSDDGVVVLMDLGSAVMSAEMALELLPEDRKDKVRLCEAPLVEGAIAAAASSAAGASLEQAIAEARSALTAKTAQLSNPPLPPSSTTGGDERGQSDKAREIHLTVRNQLGIHARPAAKFVQLAARFLSHITIQNLTKGSSPASAKSITQMATQGVRQGHEIAIAATGPDADEALAALQQLVEDNFGETAEPATSCGGTNPRTPVQSAPATTAQNQLTGISASYGIAIAPVVQYQQAIPEILHQQVDNPQTEWQQLQLAIQTAQREIQTLCSQASNQIGASELAIFQAHLLYLEDEAVLQAAHKRIFERRQSAAAAWKAVVDETRAAYQDLEDPYLKERSADANDVGQRVLRQLTGVVSLVYLPQPGILVANELTPSDVAQLDATKVLGICTAGGSATSHSAIIGRSLGIPMVVGVGAELLRLENGTLIALDGETGKVWVQPDDAKVRELHAKRSGVGLQGTRLSRGTTTQQAIARDGHQVKVMANILGVAGAQIALDAGAEGVGLLRTEFLYLDKLTAPTEEEQVATYQAIADILGTRPLIIRALDIGGDKPLPYLNLAPEANPFLGWRGIRLLLDCPDMLKTQLRAILRASHGHRIKVMFPTIASVREVRAAKQILADAKEELRQAGILFDEAIAVGIMVEVPAAVAIADRLAAEVDFFSIGTNDLSQYTMAADRTNPKVGTLADAFEPAVLRMIQQTVKAAHNAGIWVGVCGELASSPLAAPILLGLGVDELSIIPSAIASVKGAIAQLTMGEAEAIASAVLQLDSADAVREHVAAELSA